MIRLPSRHSAAALAVTFALAAFASPRAAHAHGKSCDASCAHHGHPGHDGPRLGLHHLLEGIDLRPDQREAVMRLHREAMDDRSTIEEATKPLRSELARQVRAGTFDAAALDKLVADGANALAALPPIHVKVLGKLHAILDKAQRAQVADRLAKMPPMEPSHAGEGPKHGRHGAHHGPMGGGMHMLERLLGDLDLTPSQREAIRKGLHERMHAEHDNPAHAEMRAEMRRRHEGLAERFRADTFAMTDADRIPAPMAAKRLSHLVIVPVVATPHLTLNQRERLAKRLEEGRTDDEP